MTTAYDDFEHALILKQRDEAFALLTDEQRRECVVRACQALQDDALALILDPPEQQP